MKSKAYGLYFYRNGIYTMFGYSHSILEVISELYCARNISNMWDKIIVKRLYFNAEDKLVNHKTIHTFIR